MEYKNVIFRHSKSIVKSRSECDTSCYLGKNKFKTPILAANMPAVINSDIAKIFDNNNWFYIQERMSGIQFVYDFVKNSQDNFNIISISVGIGDEWLYLLSELKREKYRIDYITIDISLSYTDNILPIVRYIKDNFKDVYLIVGNGCEPEWINWLESHSVDAAKVGVANGSVCSTYNATGIKSTLNSLVECINISQNIDIIADGGFRTDVRSGMICPSDFNTAIKFGAKFCMTGNAFSKCIDNPTKGTKYFGNASESCRNSTKNVEGITIETESHGKSINEVMSYIEESLQSSISFFGGKDLNAIKNAKHIYV